MNASEWSKWLALYEDSSQAAEDRLMLRITAVADRDADLVTDAEARLRADPATSEVAAYVLSRLAQDRRNRRKVQALNVIHRCRDEDLSAPVRRHIAIGLGRSESTHSSEALACLNDTDDEVREAVAMVLPNVYTGGAEPLRDTKSVEALLHLTRDPADGVREWAVFGLGIMMLYRGLDDEDALVALRRAQHDPAPGVRDEAAGLVAELEGSVSGAT